jgi:hypothetical protein
MLHHFITVNQYINPLLGKYYVLDATFNTVPKVVLYYVSFINNMHISITYTLKMLIPQHVSMPYTHLQGVAASFALKPQTKQYQRTLCNI